MTLKRWLKEAYVLTQHVIKPDAAGVLKPEFLPCRSSLHIIFEALAAAANEDQVEVVLKAARDEAKTTSNTICTKQAENLRVRAAKIRCTTGRLFMQHYSAAIWQHAKKFH